MATAPINQRFATLIQVLNLTKSAFAQSLEKTPSVVQHLIDGRNKPGYDLLSKVFAVYPNVSRDWLMLGKGPMLLSGETPAVPPAKPAPNHAPELPLSPAAATETASAAAALPSPVALPEPEPPLPPAQNPAATQAAAAAPEATAHPADSSRPQPPLPARPAADAPLRAADIAAVLAAAARPHRAAAPDDAPQAPPAPPTPTPTMAASPAFAAPAEAYLAAALHTQQLHHQLALAELRNQHLLEQQALLRELLTLAQRRGKK